MGLMFLTLNFSSDCMRAVAHARIMWARRLSFCKPSPTLPDRKLPPFHRIAMVGTKFGSIKPREQKRLAAEEPANLMGRFLRDGGTP